jgi:putative restriction endonuclease
MDEQDLDQRVRLAAFAFLTEQVRQRGTELPRDLLMSGFRFEGVRVPLMAPQGIFKPAILPDMPLSVTTVPPTPDRPSPYNDQLEADGILRYRYRGTDPRHRDNVALRLAMQRHAPLIYFYGLVPGRYEPIWPAYVVDDDPAALTFTVLAEDEAFLRTESGTRESSVTYETDARRRYVTTLVQRRLHQHAFRERVLLAYREQCSICSLRHRELLDAAHILPDSDPRGEPVVANGLSLCTLHHAAFDRQVLGVRPDLVVEVREDILRERDGPMLRHGLQGFQGSRLIVPRRQELQPNPDFLAARYELFRQAA